MTIEFKNFDKNETNPNPKILSIKITNQCNLTCPYCYENARMAYENEITLEDIKSMIDIVKPANSVDFGGGECLTKYDLVVQAKDYALTKTNRLRIATNGTIPINIKDFYPVPKGKSLIFTTSIDGFKEDHEKNRGQGTFEQVLDFSRELMSYGIPVVVSSVAPEHYYDNDGYLLHKFHNFLMNFGFVTHFNTAVAAIGRGENFKEDINLKLKCLKFNSKFKIHSKVCMSCEYLKNINKTPDLVSIDSLGYVRSYCQMLQHPLFHYSEYSNEKYIEEFKKIHNNNNNYGFKNGIFHPLKNEFK